jgi:hypothetical protein
MSQSKIIGGEGMKVLNYLELNKKGFGSTEYLFLQDIYPNEWNPDSDKSYIHNAIEFYSQPFSPKLIEKLFEGWEDIGNGNLIYQFEDSDLIYDNLRGLNVPDFVLRGKFKGKDLYRFQACKPSTLDRFICHCQDAGIELKWKEVNNERD